MQCARIHHSNGVNTANAEAGARKRNAEAAKPGRQLRYSLQARHAESSRHNLALKLVERVGDTLECPQAAQCSLTTCSLVGNHAANHARDHLGRGTLVDGATLGVRVGALAQELSPFDLVAVHCAAGTTKGRRETSQPPTTEPSDPKTRNRGHSREPEMFSSSVRTNTTRWPFNSSLAMTEAKRPTKWPRQSTITSFSNIWDGVTQRELPHHMAQIQKHQMRHTAALQRQHCGQAGEM